MKSEVVLFDDAALEQLVERFLQIMLSNFVWSHTLEVLLRKMQAQRPEMLSRSNAELENIILQQSGNFPG
jgi:hypothetical protein